jgi:hypothetical protein
MTNINKEVEKVLPCSCGGDHVIIGRFKLDPVNKTETFERYDEPKSHTDECRLESRPAVSELIERLIDKERQRWLLAIEDVKTDHHQRDGRSDGYDLDTCDEILRRAVGPDAGHSVEQLVAEARREAWQPIEIAPKFGYIIGAWKDGKWLAKEMWWDDTVEEWVDACSDRYCSPTHWMSLPDALESRALASEAGKEQE